MTKCNVLNISSPNIVHAWYGKSCTVEESIFIGNKVGPLFYGENVIVKVVKCFIGNNECATGSEGVNTNLASADQFVLNLDLLSSMFCEASNQGQHQDHLVKERFIYEGSLGIVCALRFNCNTRHEGYLYLIDAVLHNPSNQ